MTKVFEPLIEWLSYYAKSIVYNIEYKSIAVAAIICLGEIVWWFDVMVRSSLIIYTLDLIAWIIIAIRSKAFNITRFWQGMAKVWMFLVLLSASHNGDKIIGEMLWYDGEVARVLSIRSRCVLYFWIHELISLFKKLSQYPWFPIPKWILQKLSTYKEQLDETNIHSPEYKS